MIAGSFIAFELTCEGLGTAACAPTKVKPIGYTSSFLIASMLIASPAFAFSDLETQVRATAGGAIAKMITGTKEEGRAECDAGRALLPATAPKYLSAYIEACLAMTASEFGPHKKPESCPYYQRAIDIWRENPPPRENDEIALKRADLLKKWKHALAENCPSAAAPTTETAAKATPIGVPEGATVETLEGISYVMPGGWAVKNFDETGGHAIFKNDALKYVLRVERKAADDPGDYTEKETLSSGRILEWQHITFIPGGSFYVFYARVKFDDAYVNIGMSSSDKASNAGVDKATALGIARKLAESMKVLGPRRCIADCGPGTITAACSWCALGLGIAPANAAGPKAGDTFRDCPECPDMVVVPAGEFLMGSPASESDRRESEGPQHKVTIAKPFAVGKLEVTRDQFAAFVSAAGYKPGDKCWTSVDNKGEERAGRSYLSPGYKQEGAHPAVCVNWDDAKAYAAWLSKATGKPYRLLSEAEWEYAARAATTSRFHYSDSTDQQCGFANGADETAKASGSVPKDWTYAGCRDGYDRTAPSGSFKPNAFGLYDMHGNVWEWVEDCWHVDYEGAPTNGSAWISGNCRTRVARSGSWFHIPVNLRSAIRIAHTTDQRYYFIGLRVGRTLP